MNSDYLVRALDCDGFISVCALTTRNMVERARSIHRTAPTATAALGRVLTAASAMGADMKDEKGSVTLKIDGGGPIGAILAVSDAEGFTRGYVQNPLADPPERADGKLNVGEAVGRNGYLQVAKDFGLREPYVGRVSLVSGEIAEDVTAYYYQSEQSPAVVGLGVLIDTDCSVKQAGGFVIRVLPGAPDEIFDKIEADLPLIRPITELLEEGKTPEEIALGLLPTFSLSLLPDSKKEIGYRCSCSRERVSTALISMGRDELSSFAEDSREKEAEITCQFCDKKYMYTHKDLIELLDACQ